MVTVLSLLLPSLPLVLPAYILRFPSRFFPSFPSLIGAASHLLCSSFLRNMYPSVSSLLPIMPSPFHSIPPSPRLRTVPLGPANARLCQVHSQTS
ncbi:hypothetical protein C8R47DRAFT_711295 [Mycena vitilis]|nr:hypothetical protein C8R47DRAFT_711295 [Mycena vitilis]